MVEWVRAEGPQGLSEAQMPPEAVKTVIANTAFRSWEVQGSRGSLWHSDWSFPHVPTLVPVTLSPPSAGIFSVLWEMVLLCKFFFWNFP